MKNGLLLIVLIFLFVCCIKENPEKVKINKALEYERKGIELFKKKAHKSALNYFLKAIELAPNNVAFYNDVGACYYELKDYDNAIKYYKKAISLHSKNFNAHKGLGASYYYKGNKEKALKEWEEALLINPNDDALRELFRQTREELQNEK